MFKRSGIKIPIPRVAYMSAPSEISHHYYHHFLQGKFLQKEKNKKALKIKWWQLFSDYSSSYYSPPPPSHFIVSVKRQLDTHMWCGCGCCCNASVKKWIKHLSPFSLNSSIWSSCEEMHEIIFYSHCLSLSHSHLLCIIIKCKLQLSM